MSFSVKKILPKSGETSVLRENGTDGYVLTSNGAGNNTWEPVPSGSTGIGFTLTFAGTLPSIPAFLIPGGNSGDSLFVPEFEVDTIIPVDCTLTSVAYYSESAFNGTSISVYKNGNVAEAQIVTPASTQGVRTFSVSFTAGDLIGIQIAGVSNPGKTNIVCYFS